MIATAYEVWNPKGVMYHENLPEVPIQHPKTEMPLKVAIGIDPSTTTTGFCIGKVDSDVPFIFMDFKREETDTPFGFVTQMVDYIVYNVIGSNNVNVEYIFSEDKYEGGKKYRRHTSELLSMVKVAINSLPSRIMEISSQTKKPELHLMKPSEWRKEFLGDLNTNAKRKIIKRITTNFSARKYRMHENAQYLEDMQESVGIYSAGYSKYIAPNNKDNLMATVDLNELNWGHNITIVKRLSRDPQKEIINIVKGSGGLMERKKNYGLKLFEYKRRSSLEKNIRGLTTKSNAIFATILSTWDLEALPIYYELRKIPQQGENLVIIAYRDNIKI